MRRTWIAAALTLAFAGPALGQVPNTLYSVITNSTPASLPLAGTELLVLTQGGATHSIPFSSFFATIVAPSQITDNKTAAITASSAPFTILSQPGLSAAAVANITCNNCGYTGYDESQSVLTVPTGTTVVNSTGFASYIRNQAVTSGLARNSVNFFGISTCEVNNCAAWNFNSVIMDSDTYVLGSGSGRSVVGYEADFNIVNSNSTVIGLTVTGDSLATPASSSGFAVQPIGDRASATPRHWTWGFITQNGAADVGVHIGATQRTGTTINSQFLDFAYLDGAGTEQAIRVAGVSGGTPNLLLSSTNGTTSANLQLAGNASGIILNNFTLSTVDSSNNMFFGTSPGVTALFIGNTAVPIIMNLPTTCAGKPTGTLRNNGGVVNVC